MARLRGDPWAVLAVLSLGYFMTLLDLTIVNIAIPDMMSGLHASLDDVLWVLNSYALVLAVLMITAGRLGDLIGPRGLFAAGTAVFTAASAACGLAPGAGWLIAFRAVQGLGAALLVPQTLAIITVIFPPARRGAAFGIWGAVAGLATVAGPTLGGLLVTALGWRWVFFVNLPVGIAVLALAGVIIPGLTPGRRHRLDIPGVLLASTALLAICYGLVEGQNYSWGRITSFVSIPLILASGVVLLAAFLLHQGVRQGKEPLVPFGLFRSRNFSLMNWVACAVTLGMLGIFLTFTIYLQSVLGFSALKAGLTLAPAPAVMMLIAPAAGRLTDKVSGRYLLVPGLTLFAAGMSWTALAARPGAVWQDFLPAMVVAGAGMGCVFPPMTTLVMRDVDPRLAGAASGMFNTMRQVGAVIGTASVGALLQNRLASSLPREATIRSVILPASARQPFINGFHHTAASALQAGAGSPVTIPAGTPPALAAELQRTAQVVFTHGYVLAMRWTMVLPVAVVGLAAVSCLAITRPRRARAHARPQPAAASAASPAAPVAAAPAAGVWAAGRRLPPGPATGPTHKRP